MTSTSPGSGKIFFRIEIGGWSVYNSTGIGSPPQQAVLIIDTGSELTWLVCKPCDEECPVSPFDGSKSSSQEKVDCDNRKECDLTCAGFSHDCPFFIGYADGTYASGFTVYDRITHPSSGDTIADRLKFGCAEGLPKQFSGGSATGLVGLNQDPDSFIGQLNIKSFSFCFTSNDDLLGGSKLILNAPTEKRGISTTSLPMLSNDESFHYEIQMYGILVGKDYVLVDIEQDHAAAVANGTIADYAVVDTRTVITSLPAGFYERFRHTFTRHMMSYTVRPHASVFDTCYLHENKDQLLRLPRVAFVFGDTRFKRSINQNK